VAPFEEFAYNSSTQFSSTPAFNRKMLHRQKCLLKKFKRGFKQDLKVAIKSLYKIIKDNYFKKNSFNLKRSIISGTAVHYRKLLKWPKTPTLNLFLVPCLK
jgi:hypothetical protein